MDKLKKIKRKSECNEVYKGKVTQNLHDFNIALNIVDG